MLLSPYPSTPTMDTRLFTQDWAPATERLVRGFIAACVAVYVAGFIAGQTVHALNRWVTTHIRPLITSDTTSPTADDQADYEAWVLATGSDQFLPPRPTIEGGSDAWRIADLVQSGISLRDLQRSIPCSRQQAKRLKQGAPVTLDEIYSYQERYIPDNV